MTAEHAPEHQSKTEQTARILPSSPFDCLGVLARAIYAVVNERVDGDRGHCRLALKTADGFWRHIGTIGLKKNAIERGRRKRLANLSVALERRSTAIGDEAPQPDKALHSLPVFSKAMENAAGRGNAHTAQGLVGIVMRHAVNIVIGMTKMQLNGQISSNGDLELTFHAGDLHIAWSRFDIVNDIDVVIETDLAHAHTQRVVKKVKQLPVRCIRVTRRPIRVSPR